KNTEKITPEKILNILSAAKEVVKVQPESLRSNQGRDSEISQLLPSMRIAVKTLLNRGEKLDENTRTQLIDFMESLPEYINCGAYKFTVDQFSTHIQQWEKDIGYFRGLPGLSFLEVGCFEGRTTVWLLDNILTHETSTIVCLDTFDFSGQGFFDSCKTSDGLSIEGRFQHNIEKTGSSHKVKTIIGPSQITLRSLPLSHFNFIYIDGSHVARHVLEDAVLSWRLLKTGGIMTFDDYAWEDQLPPLVRPKIAIDSFLNVYRESYKLLRQDYQVTIKKTGND
ncbi:class I SAM-dependent methyltransferase, partial [bacterium]